MLLLRNVSSNKSIVGVHMCHVWLLKKLLRNCIFHYFAWCTLAKWFKTEFPWSLFSQGNSLSCTSRQMSQGIEELKFMSSFTNLRKIKAVIRQFCLLPFAFGKKSCTCPMDKTTVLKFREISPTTPKMTHSHEVFHGKLTKLRLTPPSWEILDQTLQLADIFSFTRPILFLKDDLCHKLVFYQHIHNSLSFAAAWFPKPFASGDRIVSVSVVIKAKLIAVFFLHLLRVNGN